MPTVMYVIDTSYLLHLYHVPGCSSTNEHNEVFRRVKNAEDTPSQRVYIPLPVLYEFANHIADVNNGAHRQNLANIFTQWVNDIIAGHDTYIIPLSREDTLLTLSNFMDQCSQYATDLAQEKLGLSDTSIISAAERLKAKYRRYRIHIWTTDNRLKAHEPDQEANAYIGA